MLQYNKMNHSHVNNVFVTDKQLLLWKWLRIFREIIERHYLLLTTLLEIYNLQNCAVARL